MTAFLFGSGLWVSVCLFVLCVFFFSVSVVWVGHTVLFEYVLKRGDACCVCVFFFRFMAF